MTLCEVILSAPYEAGVKKREVGVKRSTKSRIVHRLRAFAEPAAARESGASANWL
jgi:hypothetical protein